MSLCHSISLAATIMVSKKNIFVTQYFTITTVSTDKNTLNISFIIKILPNLNKHDKTQLLTKSKKILYLGFRATLNFQTFKAVLNLKNFKTLPKVVSHIEIRLEVLKFSHSWHNGLLPEVFDNTFQYARNIHRYNTRYSAKQNFYKHKVKPNYNAGKQSVSYMAVDIWKDLPSS